MQEIARQFARKILLLHLLLMAGVVTFILLGAREIYVTTREHAIAQATRRQSLLATQTARGIESFYQGIFSDLDLLRKSEPEENPGERPNAALAARGQMLFGPILWRQLEGRASLLFSVDRALMMPRLIGSADPELSPLTIVDRMHVWLESVDRPAISRFLKLGNGGANLVCVPMSDHSRRLLVAVVPIPQLEARFLSKINEDEHSSAWLVDETLTAMAASRPSLVGTSVAAIEDTRVGNMLIDYIRNGRAGTEVLDHPVKLQSEMLPPALITAEPIQVPGKKWELLIDVSLSEIDAVMTQVFRKVLIWAIFVVVSVSGILLSTTVQLIRSRSRLERERHDMLSRELDKAREIQLAWLPDISRQIKAIDIAAVNQPANHISGDFYNWFELPDGRLVVVIGDVTGHGMAAAFLMATTQLLVHTTMLRVGDSGRCMEEVNRQLCTQVFNGQFVTMQILVFDPSRGELEVTNAGHPPPLVGDGEEFVPLGVEPQLVLGIERNVKYPTEHFPLQERAMFLLYTDGASDVQDPAGERFYAEGLQQSLAGRYASAQSIIDGVVGAVNNFRHGRDLGDDLTLVAVQFQTTEAERPEMAAMV